MEKINPGKQNVGNSGEFFMAHILSSRGFITTITLGRAEKYDILAISPEGKNVKLQVKTLRGKGMQWRMSPKNEDIIEEDLFYAFVRLNDLEKPPEYWIFPSKVVADYVKGTHQKWKVTPRMDGKPHKETLARTFSIKTDKWWTANWTEECKKNYMNIDGGTLYGKN